MTYRILLAGLVVTFGVAQFSFAGEKLLEMGAKEWKYWDSGEKLPKEWASAEFDDSKWKSGQAPLGYGDDDIKQVISFGDDPQSKILTAYFRRSVEIEDLSEIKKVLGKFNCDDGCVIYVNGKEVHRFNLPEGELTDKTLSLMTTAGELERYTLSFLVDADKFKVGKNQKEREEKMLELQRSKRELAEAIFEGGGSPLRDLTADDLRLLLS